MKNNSSHLTLRSVVVGLAGLLLITASSMYVALKLGALPWPTVFVTIISITALSIKGKQDVMEINCAHTLMSAGSMVAGGIAFTLPGLWITDSSASMSFVSATCAALCGSALGLFFTSLYRRKFIEEEKLPYPIGQAAYRTLMAGLNGSGRKLLFSSMGLSTVFTFLRDRLLIIPATVSIFSGSQVLPAFSVYVSPMAAAIGSMIGPLLAAMWVAGMIAGHFVIIPAGISFGMFDSMDQANAFRSSLGIGLMIGTGLGVAIKAVFGIKARLHSRQQKAKTDYSAMFFSAVFLASICAVLVLFTEITPIQSLIVIAGTAVTAYLSGMLTGQTGINPMEIFAILVLLLASAITDVSLEASFTIAASVAVACGLTGDVTNDLKSGSIVGTAPKDQLTAEAIGAVAGSLIAIGVFFLMKRTFVFGSPDLPSPQAKAVASMASGLDNPASFFTGIALGLVMFLLNIPSATVGLGVYLDPMISSAIGAGALIQFIATKKWKEKGTEKGMLISSGLLGGEGICGVVIAFMTMLGV